MLKARLIARCGALLAALAMIASGPVAQARADSESPGPILAKPEQRDREAAALRIYRSAAFQAELKKAKALFAKSPLAQNPDARATLEAASEALSLGAAYYAANSDATRPFIFWGTNAARRWMGHKVPASGYGLDSPDNVYRSATFDGAGRYVVRAAVHGTGPAQQTFVVYRGLPGATKTMNAEGHMDEIAGIASENIQRDAQGNYTLTIDADPANGRPNHLQVPRDLPGMHLLVRDSLADWSRELPVELTMERLDTPPAAPRGDKALTALAIEALRGNVPFWLHWYESYVYAKPLNQIPAPWKRVQGWGMTQQGRFALKTGEAWVVTLDPLGARFFNFQISDPWTRAVEYVSRTGSFNSSQAARNADGTITLVASPVDPGVYNWLDTAGLKSGTFQVRWQGLPASVTSGEHAVRKVEVVPLADLAKHLPEGTRMADKTARVAQLAERQKSYANRLR
jgi:hypothetical protein